MKAAKVVFWDTMLAAFGIPRDATACQKMAVFLLSQQSGASPSSPRPAFHSLVTNVLSLRAAAHFKSLNVNIGQRWIYAQSSPQPDLRMARRELRFHRFRSPFWKGTGPFLWAGRLPGWKSRPRGSQQS